MLGPVIVRQSGLKSTRYGGSCAIHVYEGHYQKTKVSDKKKVVNSIRDNLSKDAIRTERTFKHTISHLQQTIGNQAVLRLFRSDASQAKLKISQPVDKTVMRMPETQVQRLTVEEQIEELAGVNPNESLDDVLDEILETVQSSEQKEEIITIKRRLREQISDEEKRELLRRLREIMQS